ncbi:MAG: hypothetical protein M0P01_11870 [Treponema sp.]|nr:hypothetical protein [Treponema sp.]
MIGLITTIVIVIVIAFFTGFNLDNRCDVNLLFHTFRNVPVFVTILISFVAGIIVALPFSFGRGKKATAKKIAKMKAKTEQDIMSKINAETKQSDTAPAGKK